VERLDLMAPRALRAALDTQPVTPGKILFAWTLAAGPTLSRAVSATWQDGTLHVRAKSAHWREELTRARPVILARLAGLLGGDVVRKLAVSGVDDVEA
jgi:hypothetical protein